MQYEGLTAVIADYIDQRRLQKLEPIEKELDKALKGSQDEVQVAQIRLDFLPAINAVNEQFQPANWLDDAAKRAKQISLVTHALKFTHGDAKGSSVLCLDTDTSSEYLTSAALARPAIDAVGNAAALDVAKLLQLESGSQSLAACVKRGDVSLLRAFTDDEHRLREWLEGFSLALADKSLSTHTLAKQLYFPLEDEGYHLLSPLFATSLAHAYYQKLATVRYGETAKAVRDARKAGIYHAQRDTRFLDTAVQSFGGSKPQNISQLNSQRGGKTILLPCAPPSWQSKLMPPLNTASIFHGELDSRAWRQVKALQDYLLTVKDRASTLDIRRKVIERVNDIIDVLLDYGAEIQSLTEQAGWSRQAGRLDKAQQLWLDPLRDDLQFQQQRAQGDWQQTLGEAFGLWLNHKLNHKLKAEGMLFAKAQQDYWHKLLKPRLRDFESGTEVLVSPSVALVSAGQARDNSQSEEHGA